MGDYQGSYTMTWRMSSVSGAADEFIIAWPGGLLDANVGTGANSVWTASGVIDKININSRDATAGQTALVEVYNFMSTAGTRQAPFSGGDGVTIPLLGNAQANNTATKNGNFDLVSHGGGGIGDFIPDPGFLANLQLIWQDKAIIEDGTSSYRDMLEFEPRAVCIYGMVVTIKSLGAVDGDWTVSIGYTPQSLGGYRKARYDMGNPANLLPI